MGMLKEFKDFAMRGNVVDLAVGVVIGASFGKIVGALVEKIVMPIVGYFQGGIDFKDYVVTLPVPELAEGMKAPTLGVGAFAQTIIDFLIVAFAIFLAVKLINSLKKAEAAAPPAAPPEDVLLLREIRDALKK
jgi:large conductance mechanosensitive channel